MSSLFAKSSREFVPFTKKNTIVFGPQGGGKSTLVAGIAKNGAKTIYIDVEGGFGQNFDGLSLLQPRTWPEIEESVALAIGSDAEVVVLDSWSRSYGFCRKHVMDQKGWATEADGGSHGKGYGVIRGEFMRVLSPLFDLKDQGRGVVLVAHEKIVKIEKPTGDLFVMEPDIQGVAGEEAGRIFDMVLCYDAEQMKTGYRHVLYSQNDGFHKAKDRTGRMPARLELPKVTGSPDERAAQVFAAVLAAYNGDGK